MIRRRREKRAEQERNIREATRPDDRTLRVLARLEAVRYRYDRSVQHLENLAAELSETMNSNAKDS